MIHSRLGICLLYNQPTLHLATVSRVILSTVRCSPQTEKRTRPSKPLLRWNAPTWRHEYGIAKARGQSPDLN